jgi:hypothetical protein
VLEELDGHSIHLKEIVKIPDGMSRTQRDDIESDDRCNARHLMKILSTRLIDIEGIFLKSSEQVEQLRVFCILRDLLKEVLEVSFLTRARGVSPRNRLSDRLCRETDADQSQAQRF